MDCLNLDVQVQVLDCNVQGHLDCLDLDIKNCKFLQFFLYDFYRTHIYVYDKDVDGESQVCSYDNYVVVHIFLTKRLGNDNIK